LAEGKTQEETALILGVSVKTVSRCARCYEQHGVAGLEPISKKKIRNHSHLEPEQEQELRAHLQEKLYPNAKAIRAYLYERYGVKYSVSGVQALLQRLGFSFKKVSVAPVKADPKKQEEFIKKYNQRRQENPQALIYFVDAIHFLHQMVASYAWILKGTTKVLPTNTGRQRINVLGAYEPRAQELIYLETLDSCNGDLVKALLEKVRALHPNVPVIFILDNVRYQHAPVVTATAEALQIHLEYLPSYSPNLN
jgi:transposase